MVKEDNCSASTQFFAHARVPDPLPDWPRTDPQVTSFEEKWSTVTECAICLQTMEEGTKVYVKDCLHPFCYACIFHWMKSFENSESRTGLSPACPICKQPATEVYSVRGGRVDIIQVVRRMQIISWSEFAATPRTARSDVMFFDPDDVYVIES